ncbi:MAG: NfeD family protein [Pyrinomonadaceae bacterium]
MEQIVPLLWLILGAALIVAEMFTLGFFLFWFGVGALAAGIVGYLGFGFGLQFLVFAITSVALTMMSRTLFVRYLPHADSDALRTGVEALPGKVGTVTSASRGALNEAAVKVYGSVWTAYPVDDDVNLNEGEKVEVVEVRGSSIYVRRVTSELPEWREG